MNVTRAERAEIYIDGQRQQLILYQGLQSTRFSISTAKNGFGEQAGSGKTPRGDHQICAKIGDGQPQNAVFVARQPTGEIYTPQLATAYPQRDWVLTRILWLSGLEPGKNQGGDVDSKQRFIYIHGTPDTEPMGQALSHGCIRMRNQDVTVLFDRVKLQARVFIDP